MNETDRLFECEFCRVKSYLMAKDVFHYRFPSSAPAGKDLFYIPYWRFKGMLFACNPGGINDKFIDAAGITGKQHAFEPPVGDIEQILACGSR